ncbi:RidA family protein [Fertoebacter nigrum]|uniref:RidA family protein n=1 Tax=Fertoeibacter niger TaxID=2656921 RepID=A0A8X8GX32_9RHOB|nr:RidA family protein [Fertoeibacter niger]NUB45903.1 RidA family protein [Fertoeibacter niger]
MAAITRHQSNEKLSRIVVHGATAYLAGITADDKTQDTQGQTAQILLKADALLASVGSGRDKLLLAQIFLRDTGDFDTMNRAWISWLNGEAPPARVTVGADFALPEIRVEIQFTAAV